MREKITFEEHKEFGRLGKIFNEKLVRTLTDRFNKAGTKVAGRKLTRHEKKAIKALSQSRDHLEEIMFRDFRREYDVQKELMGIYYGGNGEYKGERPIREKITFEEHKEFGRLGKIFRGKLTKISWNKDSNIKSKVKWAKLTRHERLVIKALDILMNHLEEIMFRDFRKECEAEKDFMDIYYGKVNDPE